VEESLRRLGTDRIDVLFLHGVRTANLESVRDALVPELRSLRAAGKVRFLAVSEAFASDHSHDALSRSLDAGDDWYDVLMVGHNLFNPSARDRVLSASAPLGIGVYVMFAVRKALGSPDGVRRVGAGMHERGEVSGDAIDLDDPLGFLLDGTGATSLAEAAYRFARHEPGGHVVLTGTGSVDHLEANVAAINAPPLPEPHQARLRDLFGHLATVSGD
jgi:L-galactose dehydrogenase